MLPLTLQSICNVLVEDGSDAAVLRPQAYGIATAASAGDKEPQGFLWLLVANAE